MLRKLIADHTPEYIAASFDLPGRTFRDDIAADYKANRAPMPVDLAEQVPLVREACEAFGVPVLTSERFEADDVIGTLAMAAHGAGFDVAIVTGDKDFFQLVTDGIRVYNPRDEGTWFDAAGVLEKFGVRPDQVVDVLALMGDSIDNIKGVPGIGEKGARELIATHGSLDAVLAAADSMTPKRREALITHADDARTSRELARIRVDVPVAFEPDTLKYRGPSRQQCFTLFSSLGFRTLVADYAPTAETSSLEVRRRHVARRGRRACEEIRTAGRVGIAAIATAESAVRADDRRLGVCDEDRHGALRARGAHGPRATRRICRRARCSRDWGPCWRTPASRKSATIRSSRRSRWAVKATCSAAWTSTPRSRATWSTRRGRATTSPGSRSSARLTAR